MKQRLRLIFVLGLSVAVFLALFLRIRGTVSSGSNETVQLTAQQTAQPTPAQSTDTSAGKAEPNQVAPTVSEIRESFSADVSGAEATHSPGPEEDEPSAELVTPTPYACIKGLVILDGKAQLSDGSGGIISHEAGLFGFDGYTYCFREDGTLAAGTTVTLDGIDYVFDDKGRWISDFRAAVEASSTARKTKQIVLVVDHDLTFWEAAEDGSWRLLMDAYCGYGANGLVEADSRIMGTRTTPIGSFPLTLAFGTEENPGTEMEYRQITTDSYWSAQEDETFNTWVESSYSMPGEHLIDYYQYKYAINIGFNLDPPVFERGCAIFLHCKGTNYWHTAGCVSLAEEDMLALMLALCDGAYIIIVPDIQAISAY